MTDPRPLTQREAQERLVAKLERNETLIRDLVSALEAVVLVISGTAMTKRAMIEALRRANGALARAKREGHK